MLILIGELNGQKIEIPVTADTGAGAPVGSIIVICSNILPSNYLGLGVQYDPTNYPALYQVLGTDTTPTASALGLPTLSSGQYAVKATSGLTENQQENVLNTINQNLSYSTTEHKTGRYWIDGKPTYEKTIVLSNLVVGENVVNISNIGALINYYGYCHISSFGWSRPFPWIDGAGRCNITRYTNTGVIIYTDSVITELAVHLEYTKTTDN